MKAGAALLVPGDRLDRYEILFEIARGGMASVYAARRTGTSSFDRVVALKVPLPHLRERAYVDLFLNEAKIASAIEHANVVQVFDLGEHEGVPFLIMEYVRGRALGEVLGRVREHDLRVSLALHVLASAGEGLHAAHTARGADGQPLGIVHRDVSPQNVLVAYAGQVKVADFGIAHAHDRPVATRTGELRGKLQYLAPEQITRDEPVSARTDVWSLGVMAWEAMMQRSLFLGANDAETLWNVCAKTYPGVDLPDALRPTDLGRVVEACLRRRPSERPASAAELAGALREALSHARIATDVARTMNEAFAAEMLADQERLASALAVRGKPATAVGTERRVSEWAVTNTDRAALRATAGESPGAASSRRARTETRDVSTPAAALWRSRLLRRKRTWLWVALAGAGAIVWALVQAQTIVKTPPQLPSRATLVGQTADANRAGSSAPSTAVLPSPTVTALAASATTALAASATTALASSSLDPRRPVPARVARTPSASASSSPLLGSPYASPAGSR